ncbi:ATP-binding protein [Flaviaesturariibacter flavus]|uniref:ATP-binding protein n=1 Tax=Flaviaesturariibacter flavus TaxID=2502780 RepID=UPI001404B896|nr:ATP-binding protein [Flaviaesturariibacter flavus]
MEHLLDAVLVVDATDTIVYANRAAGELFRRPAEALLGQPFGRTTEPGVIQEITLLRNGRMQTAEMLVSAIEWNGAPASLLALRDVTAARAASAELERQRHELERSNEENARFASFVSHDLRQPVRKIIFNAGLLLDGTGIADGARKRVEAIQASAIRMRGLINGIEQISNVGHQRPPFEPVDLNNVLREVRADLELLLLEKDGRLESDTLPVIDAVPGEMYQLLLNLVGNALKYSRPDVAPVVRVHEVAGAGADWCCIACSDNGMGFPESVGPRLFQPFERHHREGIEGMGVGLALCQKIVDAHGGTIRAEGTEGAGATFTFCLPRRQETPHHDPSSGNRHR